MSAQSAARLLSPHGSLLQQAPCLVGRLRVPTVQVQGLRGVADGVNATNGAPSPHGSMGASGRCRKKPPAPSAACGSGSNHNNRVTKLGLCHEARKILPPSAGTRQTLQIRQILPGWRIDWCDRVHAVQARLSRSCSHRNQSLTSPDSSRRCARTSTFTRARNSHHKAAKIRAWAWLCAGRRYFAFAATRNATEAHAICGNDAGLTLRPRLPEPERLRLGFGKTACPPDTREQERSMNEMFAQGDLLIERVGDRRAFRHHPGARMRPAPRCSPKASTPATVTRSSIG